MSRSALALLIFVTVTRAALAAERPCIVIFYADDLGIGDLGCYGCEDIATPGIDKLAREGLRFTNYYCPAPLCAPSRAALLTGRSPVRIGLSLSRNINSMPGEVGMPTSEITIAELARSAGYATGLIGKWHLGFTPETDPNAQGFDSFFGHHAALIDYYSHWFFWGEPYFHDLYFNRQPVERYGRHMTELVTEQAIAFLDQHREKPFLLYVAYNAPHYPIQPQGQFREQYRHLPGARAGYAALVAGLDASVGRILDRLDALGLTEQTLVFFSSDNGAAAASPRGEGGGSNAPYREHKRSLFDGGIHMPALLRWPRKAPAGQVRQQLACSMDIFPTVAEAIEATVPTDRTLDGKSWMPLFKSESAHVHDRLFFEWDGQSAVREGKWKLVRDGFVDLGRSRNRRSTGDDAVFLADVSVDPGETRNLRKQHPETANALLARHGEWLRAASATSRPATSAENKSGPAADRAISIGVRVPQLFIDDALIESQTGLKRTLHQPLKDNGGNSPIIAGPKGQTILAYGSILRDPRLGRYVMFTKTYPGFETFRLTSRDGLEWVQGDDGRPDPVAIDLIDATSGRKATNTDLFSCYYDVRDSEYPYKGWMWFANWGDDLEGAYYMRSADGRKWERVRQVVNGWAGGDDPSCREILQRGRVLRGPGDVTLFAHDPLSGRFLGIFKFFTPYRVDPLKPEKPPTTRPKGKAGKAIPGNDLRSRAYAFLDRLDEPFDARRIDHVELLPPAADTSGDKPYDEYYASTAWRYGSLWLGGLKVWHSQDDYPHSAAGCAFLKLVVSRDGLSWHKVQYPNETGMPEVFLPNGLEGGNHGSNDGGYISEFSQGPLRINDELVYYYSASSYGKNHAPGVRLTGGGIFRARLRVDGFVSVEAGTLTTRPLAFEGQDLLVNAAGRVRVEVLSTDGKQLAAAELAGDSIEHTVRFSGRSLAEVAASRPIRLRFTILLKGRLYAFQTC